MSKRKQPPDVAVDILGTRYTLKYRQPDDNNNKTFQNNQLLGYCSPNSKELVINLGQSLVQRRKTIIHECIHAFFCESGQTEYQDDERLVNALEVLTPKMCKLFERLGVLE